MSSNTKTILIVGAIAVAGFFFLKSSAVSQIASSNMADLQGWANGEANPAVAAQELAFLATLTPDQVNLMHQVYLYFKNNWDKSYLTQPAIDFYNTVVAGGHGFHW